MTIFRCKAQIMNMDYLKLAELGFNTRSQEIGDRIIQNTSICMLLSPLKNLYQIFILFCNKTYRLII